MIAPAPGLLSMTMGCPRRLPTASAAARAMRSFAPPGPKGTTHLTGRSGQSAPATLELTSAAAVANAVTIANKDWRAGIDSLRERVWILAVCRGRREADFLQRLFRQHIGRLHELAVIVDDFRELQSGEHRHREDFLHGAAE